MFGKTITVVTLAAAILLSVLLQTTTPASAGPVGVLAVFFLYYVLSLGAMTWIIRGGSLVLARLLRPLTIKKPFRLLTLGKSYYLASVVALAPVMLLGMSSVSKLGFYEVALVLAFVAIGVFYIVKRTN